MSISLGQGLQYSHHMQSDDPWFSRIALMRSQSSDVKRQSPSTTLTISSIFSTVSIPGIGTTLSNCNRYLMAKFASVNCPPAKDFIARKPTSCFLASSTKWSSAWLLTKLNGNKTTSNSPDVTTF